MILFLDSNIVIYSVEKHPVFGPKVAWRMANAVANGDTFMVSDLSRMECLVGPLKSGNKSLETQFRGFFSLPDVQVAAIAAAVCERAAIVRAIKNFKQLDSLQLAAAVEHGANVFLTADARLKSFTDIAVEILK